MNIIVQSASGHIFARPDTSWEKDNEDLYLPEMVKSLDFCPVLFARVSKPGRSIGSAFASRYYDAIGFGLMLYPHFEDGDSQIPELFAQSLCLDHCSFLPYPLYNPITLGQPGNEFLLKLNSTELFRCSAPDRNFIEETLCRASRFCYLRVGDIVAADLAPRRPLELLQGGEQHILAMYCENTVLDFYIK
ncbi:MAG: hypothetical protein ACI3ZK_01835 [Candidatus Cryptobacteroides sp.]